MTRAIGLALLLALAAFAYISVLLADSLMQRWFVRDLDIRSNLIAGTVSGSDTVRLRKGPEVRVPPEALADRTGDVAVGIRPEKIELGGGHENALEGKVVEQAYVGVATQYIVETDCGRLTVYRQNAAPGLNGAASGERLTLSWNPESAFVVDPPKGAE